MEAMPSLDRFEAVDGYFSEAAGFFLSHTAYNSTGRSSGAQDAAEFCFNRAAVAVENLTDSLRRKAVLVRQLVYPSSLGFLLSDPFVPLIQVCPGAAFDSPCYVVFRGFGNIDQGPLNILLHFLQ